MCKKCSHCKLEYKIALHEVKRNDKTLYFCCNGCELAYTLLEENNLTSFYEKVGDRTLKTKEIQDSKIDMDYDSINFKEKYIETNSNGFCEISFFIEGIVCAACIWLNERIISNINGIIEVKINYTSHIAKIIFNPNITTFKNITQEIRKIGYRVNVFKDDKKDSKLNKMFLKLIIAIFCTMNIMWVNVGQYVGFWSGIDDVFKNILNLASFILSTPVLFYSGSIFYRNAYNGLKNNVIGMDLLIITGSSIVYFYSIYAWLILKSETFFESVSMIILFILSAKYFENKSKNHVNQNLDRLNSILPLTARLQDGNIISINDVKVGDILLSLPGEMIACDGILKNAATLDYSNISGESTPLDKNENEQILAGSITLNTPIIFEVKSIFKDSNISKLTKLLNDSSFSTPEIATMAFKMSSIFSKIVLSIAFLGFLFYLFILNFDFSHSLLIAVSVIVIACPCALALATPIASLVGLNVGFREKIIFTHANFLESLAKSNIVIFDKTGTLTKGELVVQRYEGELWEINEKINLSSIMSLNPHAISNAIINYLGEKLNDRHMEMHNLEIISGRGFKVELGEYLLFGGNEKFLKDENFDLKLNGNEDEIIFSLVLQKNKEFQTCTFYLKDELKENALELITELKKMKKEIVILSGDRESVVRCVAEKLGVKKYFHSKTPLEKADIVNDLTKNKIVFIGDGLNDSLALKLAHVGIVMGNGSDISIAKSNVVILDNDLKTLLKSFKIANLTLRFIKGNLKLSIMYNVIALPLALGGFIIPLFAALFMSLSSVSVLLNSLRLYKYKFK